MGTETLTMKSNETVTVACKLPNGLILDAFVWKEENEFVMGGGTRVVKRAHRLPGHRVVINGNAAPPDKDPRDRTGKPIPVERGFALTHNVPKAVWDNWLSFNKDEPIVVNGLIFASSKPAELSAEARDKGGQQTRMEPMNTVSDVRMPKREQKANAGSIGALETAEKVA